MIKFSRIKWKNNNTFHSRGKPLKFLSLLEFPQKATAAFSQFELFGFGIVNGNKNSLGE